MRALWSAIGIANCQSTFRHVVLASDLGVGEARKDVDSLYHEHGGSEKGDGSDSVADRGRRRILLIVIVQVLLIILLS
eukprot:4366026-Amphidinium_carterae.1